MPGRAVIIDARHPATVTAGQPYDWRVIAEVRDGPVENPCAGYLYVDGPVDSVHVIVGTGRRHAVRRGTAVVGTEPGVQQPGTRVDTKYFFGGAVLPAPGTYKIALIAGTYDYNTGIVLIHDRRDFVVTCAPGKREERREERPSPVYPSPSPSPSPVHRLPLAPSRLPAWAAPAAAGCAGLAFALLAARVLVPRRQAVYVVRRS
jgi:hypothetical protein